MENSHGLEPSAARRTMQSSGHRPREGGGAAAPEDGEVPQRLFLVRVENCWFRARVRGRKTLSIFF